MPGSKSFDLLLAAARTGHADRVLTTIRSHRPSVAIDPRGIQLRGPAPSSKPLHSRPPSSPIWEDIDRVGPSSWLAALCCGLLFLRSSVCLARDWRTPPPSFRTPPLGLGMNDGAEMVAPPGQLQCGPWIELAGSALLARDNKSCKMARRYGT